MTSPPEPLLQVCHAGLLTLAALMAEQAHQLPHITLEPFPDIPLRQPSVRISQRDSTNDTNPREEPKKSQRNSIYSTNEPEMDVQVDASKTCRKPEGKELPDEVDLPSLDLPCAPIYSFDEDGDILQCVGETTGSYGEREERLGKTTNACMEHEDTCKTEGTDGSLLTTYRTADGDCSKTTIKNTLIRKNQDVLLTKEVRDTCVSPSCRDHTRTTITTTQDISHKRVLVPKVMVESNHVTPKIKLHAGSVEVEDDYLEGHLEEDHLRDFCATLLGECARSPVSRTPAVMELLSVTPQDSSSTSNPSKKVPRVPFDAVVFTERKPSTGDALVLSLGLSADGANTIQDIASRNQGAARERLQQCEAAVPCEVMLTRQCESCGVSPEECLKKLGLHSDNAKPNPSPKNERVLHFFRHHTPAGGADPSHGPGTRITPNTTPLSSPHDYERGNLTTKSRSLSNSPIGAENGGKKSRLVAL